MAAFWIVSGWLPAGLRRALRGVRAVAQAQFVAGLVKRFLGLVLMAISFGWAWVCAPRKTIDIWDFCAILESMPTLATFYGIIITMNYNDHLPPHFHAEYQDFEATVEIAGGLVTGKMPRRALKLIWSWLDEHRDEVMENWERAEARRALKPVEPLR